MTQEEFEKVRNSILNAIGKDDFKCPICGCTDWGLENKVYQMPQFFNSPLEEMLEKDKTNFPVIPATCEKCGNVILFSAIQHGIVKNEEEDL